MAINFKRLEEITRSIKGPKQTGRAFHATFVYLGNKMICIGHNDYSKIHPYHRFGEYKNRHTDGAKYISGIHSECSALIKLGLDDCSHLNFVNIRICNNDKPAISKPCLNCERTMKKIGYKNLWYFDGETYVKLQS